MAEEKIWFILSEGQTKGPFSLEEVEVQLSQQKEAQIWGRGQAEWMSPAKWRTALKQNGYVTSTPAATPENPQGLWRIKIEGEEKKPLRFTEMIALLKELPDLSYVDVMAEAGSTWQEVYSVPRIIDELGLSRRNHPRVPLMGTLTFEVPQGESSCRVISISEGGIGINDARDMHIGNRFSGSLKSPNLYVTIECQFEVVYVGADGYAGLRFIDLAEEFKNSVIEYVNKFSTP